MTPSLLQRLRRPCPNALATVVVTIAAALALTACGDDEQKGTTAASTTPPATKTAATTTTDPKKKKKPEARRPAEPKAATAPCTTAEGIKCTAVGPKETISVDDLVWKVLGVRTAKELGDADIGTSSKTQRGVYVIVELSVRSNRKDPLTITQDMVQLFDGQNHIKFDTGATVATTTTGDSPLVLEEVLAGDTSEGVLVWDVPRSYLDRTLQLSVQQFIEKKERAFIRLPDIKG